MPEIEIEEKPHSSMGPSSFERVEACTASAILGQGMAKPSSVWAAEGTAMHEAWARCVKGEAEAYEFIGDTFKVGEHLILFDAEMADAVHTGVVFARAFLGEKWVEKQLHLGDMMWGWADLIVPGHPVTVIDMKFGAGVEVVAETPQTGCYGLMAGLQLNGVSWLKQGPGDEVLVNSIICQPRGRGKDLKPHAWTRADLQALHLRIIATARAVRERTLVYKVSAKCRWCAVVPTCPALRLAARDAAMMSVFSDPEMAETVHFDGEQLDAAMEVVPALELWIKKVSELAMGYMEAGGKLRTSKLVNKRAVRDWRDETAAEAWLRLIGVHPFQPAKLLSPAMAEAKVTKDKIATIGEMVTKQSSGLTMAPRDDPRPEVKLHVATVNMGLLQSTAADLLNKANANLKLEN